MDISPSLTVLSEIHVSVREPEVFCSALGEVLDLDFQLRDYGFSDSFYQADLNGLGIAVHQECQDAGRGATPRFSQRLVFDIQDYPEGLERATKVGFDTESLRISPGVKATLLTGFDGVEILMRHQPSWWYFRIEHLRRMEWKAWRAFRLRSNKRSRSKVGSSGAGASRNSSWATSWARLKKSVRFSLIDPLSYRRNTVKILHRDLKDYELLASSHDGLYAVSRDSYRKVLSGQFFGITRRGDSLFVFQAHGPQAALAPRGRVVRLDLQDRVIQSARVVAKGLGNGCHQMDFINGCLHVVDTYRQEIVVYNHDFSKSEVRRPFGRPKMWDWKSGYLHINSLLQRDEDIFFVMHNSTAHSGRRSLLTRCDLDLSPKEEIRLEGGMCHNLVFLEDGSSLICDSMAGRVIDADGQVVIDIGAPAFLRGLSVGDELIAVGESEVGEKRFRQIFSSGKVYFFNREYQLIDTLHLSTAIMDLRRIDGRDFGLSGYGNQESR